MTGIDENNGAQLDGAAHEETLSRRSFMKTIGSLTAAGTALAALEDEVHAAPAEGTLSVGAAKRIITPDPLLPVSGGMGPTHPTSTKQGDITVRAVVIKKADTSLAIVSLDLLGFPSALGDRVRAKVPRIPAANVIIGSTHTHSAPDCYAFPDGKGGHTGDLKYMDHVVMLAAEAINEAIDRAVPAKMRAATDVAKGKISYNYYAPDLCDHRMGVVQFQALSGGTVATLVNYAIHPEVLGNDLGVLSPDLIGPLNDAIEAGTGGMSIFMNSAQGGMVTADNRYLDRPKDPRRAYWEDERSWAECLRIGQTMAKEALRIIAPAAFQENPSVYCRSTRVTIPIDSPDLWAVVTMSPLKYKHTADRKISVTVNLLNLGNCQVVTCPGEALPNIGSYVKRKMKGQNNLFFGLTNDAFGYILTRVDWNAFPRYEYCSRVCMGENTAEILIEKWLGLINSSPLPDGAKA